MSISEARERRERDEQLNRQFAGVSCIFVAFFLAACALELGSPEAAVLIFVVLIAMAIGILESGRREAAHLNLQNSRILEAFRKAVVLGESRFLLHPRHDQYALISLFSCRGFEASANGEKRAITLRVKRTKNGFSDLAKAIADLECDIAEYQLGKGGLRLLPPRATVDLSHYVGTVFDRNPGGEFPESFHDAVFAACKLRMETSEFSSVGLFPKRTISRSYPPNRGTIYFKRALSVPEPLFATSNAKLDTENVFQEPQKYSVLGMLLTIGVTVIGVAILVYFIEFNSGNRAGRAPAPIQKSPTASTSTAQSTAAVAASDKERSAVPRAESWPSSSDTADASRRSKARRQAQVPLAPETPIEDAKDPNANAPIVQDPLEVRIQRREQVVTNSIGMHFRLITSATYRMHHETGDADLDGMLLQDYYIGLHEVTESQYGRVVAGHDTSSEDKDLPAGMVSWHRAVEFCERLSSLEDAESKGYRYRLPMEREWEYACTGGSEAKYFFGDTQSRLKEFAWYSDNSGSAPVNGNQLWGRTDYRGQLELAKCRRHPVGTLRPNPFGLFDVYGNVWEWCFDVYETEVSGSEITSTSRFARRVIRGGGHLDPGTRCNSFDRFAGYPDHIDIDAGFRVVLEISGPATSPPLEESAKPVMDE